MELMGNRDTEKHIAQILGQGRVETGDDDAVQIDKTRTGRGE